MWEKIHFDLMKVNQSWNKTIMYVLPFESVDQGWYFVHEFCYLTSWKWKLCPLSGMDTFYISVQPRSAIISCTYVKFVNSWKHFTCINYSRSQNLFVTSIKLQLNNHSRYQKIPYLIHNWNMQNTKWKCYFFSLKL